MTQEEKQLLLTDLCTRLPYGVKILHTGWDCDSDTDFDTIETLIGIDDMFIYTVWDKTGDREKHCLSIPNWKPFLRLMSSITEEEKIEIRKLKDSFDFNCYAGGKYSSQMNLAVADWLNAHHFDYRGLIKKGLALETSEGMYNIK